MGRPPWATAEQLQWLIAKIPDYRDARRQKKFGDFWAEVIAAFFQEFPQSNASDEENEQTRGVRPLIIIRTGGAD